MKKILAAIAIFLVMGFTGATISQAQKQLFTPIEKIDFKIDEKKTYDIDNDGIIDETKYTEYKEFGRRIIWDIDFNDDGIVDVRTEGKYSGASKQAHESTFTGIGYKWEDIDLKNPRITENNNEIINSIYYTTSEGNKFEICFDLKKSGRTNYINKEVKRTSKKH